MRWMIFLFLFIIGCDYGNSTQPLNVEFLDGYSPYDFESSIKDKYFINSDKKKMLENILVKVDRDYKLKQIELDFLESADIKGKFSSYIKKNIYATKFLFFVLSADIKYEKVINPNVVGFYLDKEAQVIAIKCPTSKEIICSELDYPEDRGWVWRYGARSNN